MHDMQSAPNGVHERHESQELMRAEQVGLLLGIDRSTVYRMAEQGRLPALKIGRQWRFPPHQIRRLLATEPSRPPGAGGPGRELMTTATEAALPMIELAAQILGVMVVATDMHGDPVTEPVNPCPWFAEHAEDPELLSACLADWKERADDLDLEISFRTGQLGLDCARVFVRHEAQLVGMLLAGCVAATDSEARQVYRLNPERRGWVLSSLPAVAARVSRLLASGSLPDLDTKGLT